MHLLKAATALAAGLLCCHASSPSLTPARQSGALQDVVTWDSHSFYVRGERIFIFSGEVHPFRIPVPGLWLDIFQKIKAMGFNTVSFYTMWALLEGERGHVITDGIWSLEAFFSAASEAGIYLIARPGPYINAEVAAGGMPGWTLRINATLRGDAPEYLNATKLYLSTLGQQIAKAQVTNGGPVVMIQPENEYSTWPKTSVAQFPNQINRNYMAFVEQQFRDAGITVPTISNDPDMEGYWAAGTGLGSVDIYGIDSYPNRYGCSNPSVWPTVRWPQDWQILHEQQSPSTPFAIPEFQGGTTTGWGPGNVQQDACNALVNEESVRVFYKHNYSFGVKLLNIYMTYGGTNWGNIAVQGGDTSYEYGAAMTEDRHVWREKYSEEKLQANWLRVSPAYLTAAPGNASNGSYVSTNAINTTPLFGTNTTNFYIIRHAEFTTFNNTSYQLHIRTTAGNLTIPQLGGQLSLRGRDSKVHVTDYDVGGVNLVYCTADIFTWAKSDQGRRVLLMYGGANELHEFAVGKDAGSPAVREGSGIKTKTVGSTWVVQWNVTNSRQVVYFASAQLEVHMLWRNDAYTHWVLELPAAAPVGNFSLPSKCFVVVKGGYLMRTASIVGSELRLTGDINATTNFELIYAPTANLSSLSLNGHTLQAASQNGSRLGGQAVFKVPSITLPDLSTAEWRYIDNLPETQPSFDDSLWPVCDHKNTTNDQLALEMPTSLYASDYGFHAGSLMYRGHFKANGQESTLLLNVTGGEAFGYSAWLNRTFLGSWTGNQPNRTYPLTFNFSSTLATGSAYVVTVLIDHLGQNQQVPGTDSLKWPYGILNYTLSGHPQTDVTWKMTGNFGGEQYPDKARGPRNEGAMYAERQGYHQPAPPSANWTISSPVKDGLLRPGVGFYSTSFDLDVPDRYDAPMSFVFNNGTYGKFGTPNGNYRVQLFVNGYQFGKYIHNSGPQSTYPVPEGILNHHGTNYVSITLWALDASGAKLDGLDLVVHMPVWSGYSRPALSPQPAWKLRDGAY